MYLYIVAIILFRECAITVLVQRCPIIGKGYENGIKILCAIALIYFQVEGVGPNGRMFLFKKPSLEDQNATLWNMYYSMKREKDSLREKLNYEVSISTLSL